MLSIQTNLSAINANNYLKSNTKNNARAIEKLSSGYRINRAADDAAGLAISEKMRRLIRGLRQGTANAQDGVSFVQVADGAMDGVSGMLLRMYELAVKSMNGTCSQSDRAAMNDEFDQLRTEIDRINKTTQFNDQPVFDEHEGSYYEITGSKRWEDNQLHTVPALNNELNIHLPDYYNPSDYSLSVPPGVYTTQELVDEIDSALERMTPHNPGFVFEYTDKGVCKLNFERFDGMPTEIDAIDGSLSYLFFDSFNGSSSSSLMGTTVFDAQYPLTITKGQNDELGFYVENASGTKYVDMIIPQGSYSRAQMINLINENLAKQNLTSTGVIAKEYGASSIQITGGDGTSITGLKGNMFKLETSSPIYSSVFYDNVQYGYSTGGTSAYINGKAYYGNDVTEKIYLSSANKNNVLRFKINGAADYTEITFADKNDGYTMSEIAKVIHDQLDAQGLLDKVSVGTGSTSIPRLVSPNTYSYYTVQYLGMFSLIQGTGSSLEFDTTDTVAANTYKALFQDTNYLPYSYNGHTALLRGGAVLKNPITLPTSASLSFTVNDTAYTINNIGGTYATTQDLISTLNNHIQTDSALSAIKDKIEFGTSSGYISIEGKSVDIRKIFFAQAQQNDTYKQLFVGTSTALNSVSTRSTYGTVTRPQGSTAVTVTPATASVYIPSDKQGSINITSTTNKIMLSTSDGTKTITLATGPSSIASIIAQMNAQLKPSANSCFSSIKASFENDYIVVTAIPSTSNSNGNNYSVDFYSNCSAWYAIHGTHPTYSTPSIREASDYVLGTQTAIADGATLDSSNNELELTVGTDTATIQINPGTYSSKEALKNAVEAAISNNPTLKDKVNVVLESNGTLVFKSLTGAIDASGSFYEKVLITLQTQTESKEQGTYANYSFENAFIIGRKDLTVEPVEIVSGANDTFVFNFAYKDTSSHAQGDKSYSKEMEVTIPEGKYTGDQIAAVLQDLMQKKFEAEGLEDFEIEAQIGGHDTQVVGANDLTALQIRVKRKAGKEPAQGQYVLDGIRGSAAGFLFYKTIINPNATFITGTKDLSKGIVFKPGQNVFTLSADSIPYKYTFPENKEYSGEELVDLLNDMFANGDDNGNPAPLKASLENGALKISHKALGSHSITDIGGSARGTLFLEETSGVSREPLRLLVGSESTDTIDIPRTRVSSCSLAINTITISKPKYAQKAADRLTEALIMLTDRRSTYGAMQNRLEHTIDNNNNIIENTQASESIIRDADMAFQAVEQAKNSVLVQVSQTILAQANQQLQQVMNLLQA